ncbi:MAG: hypothetical protein ACRD0K_09490 [Egibacteraceae bacterium]
MRLIALLLALLLASACGGSSTSGGAQAVAEAQSALVFPAIGLGEALVQSQRQLDRVRHEIPRGQAMKAALGEYAVQVTQLRATAAQVSMVAQRLDERSPVVREAAVTVEGLLALASVVSGAAESEAAAYNRLADIDMAMDGIVAGWDQGGSLAELRIALRRLSAQAEDLAEAAGDVPPMPAACATPRDSRVRWGALLRIRTDQLSELVTSRTGLQYDALRDRFRPQPYGEDRLAADAATRQCWLDYSPVAHAEQQAVAGIARLRELLIS